MSLSASIFFSVAFLIIKSLEPHGVKAFGGALLFNTGVLIPCIIAIIFNEFGPGWKSRTRVSNTLLPLDFKIFAFMMAQGILQGSSVVFRTFSLQYLSVGDMTVIVFSSPIVTTILARIFLDENCGLIFIIIAIFTFAGVALITKPPVLTGAKEFDEKTLIGSGLAVGALISLSMKFVVTRRIKNAHFLAMTFFLGFCGILISLPLFLIYEEIDSLIPTSVTGLLLRIGLFTGFGAVGSINLALKMENAGLVALVRSFDVIFAFLLQYFFLGVVPDFLSAIGAGVVLIGVFIAGFRKWIEERQKSNRNDEKIKSLEGNFQDITQYENQEHEDTRL